MLLGYVQQGAPHVAGSQRGCRTRQPFVASSLRGGDWADDEGLKETKASVVKWSRDLGTIADAGKYHRREHRVWGRDEYDIPKTLRPREKNRGRGDVSVCATTGVRRLVNMLRGWRRANCPLGKS